MSENPYQKSYYTIGEVAEMLDVSTSLLRFWEKEFHQLKPSASHKGHRRYTPKDIELLKYIQILTKEKGYTLDGVKALLKDEKKMDEKAKLLDELSTLRGFLEQLLTVLKQR